jgi:hypothetical protein
VSCPTASGAGVGAVALGAAGPPGAVVCPAPPPESTAHAHIANAEAIEIDEMSLFIAESPNLN